MAEPEITEEERAALIRGVERAAATLDEIVEEVSHEVFVSEATAYIYSEDPDVALADAVRGAVTRRLEWLDSDFLAAVGAYTEAAGKMGNGQLVELLEMLRKEVLAQVTLRMPPSVRVLDAALQHEGISARLKVLRTALGGGEGDVPGADMQSLSATANQFVDDMEDQEVIADRVLLARLVLVREELRALHFRALEQQAGLEFTGGGRAARAAAPATAPPADADARGGRLSGPEEAAAPSAAGEGGDGDGGSSSGGAGAEARGDAKSIALDSAAVAAADDGGFFSFHRGNLPRRCAAFLQALLAVGEPPRRLALLRKAFNEDWDGAGPARPPGSVPAGSAGGAEAGAEVQEAPDVVRPGRLLATLHAMRRELQIRQGSVGVTPTAAPSGGDGSSGGGGGKGGGENLGPLLKRLNQIQIEATLVLDEMQRGKTSGSGGGGSKGGPDTSSAGPAASG